ncbi:MAG TPA: COX15/CtaA family protein [Burkholderiales bacterium]|nr:COX15/CtaA family protein [Burkholderiales bacterium]
MRPLALLSACLTFVVVVVGAYVRLSDAGLGCPDWPLCYGQPLPADIADADALAKAWKEMGHRYLAAALGLLILLLAFVAWRKRQAPWLATAIAALVVIQATLGKWTVTMLLKPAIVTAHLLGGMAILALLVWMALSQSQFQYSKQGREVRVPAVLALAVLAIQIALGGWVSANYAGLACLDLPLCQGRWLPMDALTAIHWSHRVFAVVVLVVVGWTAIKTMKIFPRLGGAIALLLLLQLALGVANVAFSLPLALAAAHNAGAALLLAALVVLNFFAFRGLRP